MKKLKLDIDSLEVQSFIIEEKKYSNGTVLGYREMDINHANPGKDILKAWLTDEIGSECSNAGPCSMYTDRLVIHC